MGIHLEPLAAENWEECATLAVGDGQLDYVYTNLFAIAKAGVFGWETFVIRAGSEGQNDVVGMAMFDWNPPGRTGFTAVLHQFMIGEEHQGRGYGRAALGAVIELARKREARHLLLSYWPGNPAVKLYESLGFRHIGEFWGDNGEEPVMQLDL